MNGQTLSDPQINGGQISATVTTASGKEANVEMFNAAQFEKPDIPHTMVQGSDGSTWYQTAIGPGAAEFYQPMQFFGDASETAQARPQARICTSNCGMNGMLHTIRMTRCLRKYHEGSMEEKPNGNKA
jgi:hypothetical protein